MKVRSVAILMAMLCGCSLWPAAAMAQQANREKPAAIMEGYPAFDAPLVHFALKRQRVAVETWEKKWLETNEYEKFGLVVVVGDLVRAKMEPNRYSAEDVKRVKEYLEQGGQLMLMRGTSQIFSGPEGKAFLMEVTGYGPLQKEPTFAVLQPDHAWLAKVDAKQDYAWLNTPGTVPLRTSKGEIIIGTSKGLATLYRVPVGKGALIYVGWDFSRWLPNGREKSSVEAEQVFESQMTVLLSLVANLYAKGQ